MTSAPHTLSSAFWWPEAPPLATAETARGPTLLSNWVIRESLAVGGYPSAAELTRAQAFAHAMAEARFDTYINLMQPNELRRFRPYAPMIVQAGAKLTPPLPTPEFLHFPIGDGATPENDQHFIALIYHLLAKLKAGRRVYAHCYGGHGRTGMVTSVLLAVIDPNRTVEQALETCQFLHSQREYNPHYKSPEHSQIPYVKRIVEMIKQLPSNYSPPADFKLQLLEYQTPTEDDPMTDDSSDGALDARARARARLAARNAAPAGNGEGVIVVDSHGTASTTQASSSVPSTPLQPPTRRVSRDGIPPIPPMPSGLLQREMVPIVDTHRTVPMDNATSPAPPAFTILQMNILADTLCTPQSFPHAAAGALEWNTRKQLLLDELTGANRPPGDQPDIICVQECDHYADFFQSELASRGYGQSFFFKKHASESADGAAIFIRDTRFRVLHQTAFRLASDMNQVTILAQLAPLDANQQIDPIRRLYLCTTHFKAKDGYELVRLKQAQLTLAHLQQFIARYHTGSLRRKSDGNMEDDGVSPNPPHASLGFALPTHAAVLFAGDLNDMPHSPAYNFIATGSSSVNTNAVTSASSVSTATVVATPSGAESSAATVPMSPVAVSPRLASPVTHPFWLQSLYNRHFDAQHLAHHPGELYTTVKKRSVLVQRTIDYIFFSPATLQPLALLNIPPIATDLPDYLPAVNYPSDHLALAGRFEWR